MGFDTNSAEKAASGGKVCHLESRWRIRLNQELLRGRFKGAFYDFSKAWLPVMNKEPVSVLHIFLPVYVNHFTRNLCRCDIDWPCLYPLFWANIDELCRPESVFSPCICKSKPNINKSCGTPDRCASGIRF